MICFECDSDGFLVRSLGFARKQLHHSGNKGAVCNDLRNNKNLKGLVDEDPGSPQPKYMIHELEQTDEKERIKKLKDPKRGNILIVLCPKLEDWIIETVKQAGRNMSDFRLPDDPGELQKKFAAKPERVRLIIDKIKDRSVGLKALRSFLTGG